MAGIFHFANAINIWNVESFSNNDYIKANVLISLFLFCIIIGYKLIKKQFKFRSNIINKNLISSYSSDYLYLLTFVNIALALLILAKFGLPYLTSKSSDTTDSIGSYVYYSLIPKFSLVVWAINLCKIKEKSKLRVSSLLMINTVLLLLMNSPIRVSRSIILLFIVITLGIINKGINRKGLLIFLALIGMTFVLPLLNFFKTWSMKYVYFGFDFSSPDFDAYELLMTTIKYTDLNGYSFGNNILSALLFFVPRKIWLGKALNTGSIVLTFYNSNFTNVSCPLVSEFYYAFGVPGVVIFSLGFGLIAKIIDNFYYSNSFDLNFILFSCVGMFFAVFRGSLLQGIVYTLSPIIVVLMVSLFYKLFFKRSKNSSHFLIQKETRVR